jgi:hypothetical protein
VTDWPGYAQAAATLLAGLAAVVAAVIVGLRQAGIARTQAEISRRQTEILGRQVLLDELKNRSDVFDRRFAIYQATVKLLSEVMVHAAKASGDTERDFLRALDQSKFLFRPAVYESLRTLWADYCMFGAFKSIMEAGPQHPEYHQSVDGEHASLLAFNERLGSLSELFGDELVIAAPAAATEEVAA